MLRTWVSEGRIAPASFLIEEATGRQIHAQMVPGLFEGNYYRPPSEFGYQPPPDNGKKDIRSSYIYTILSFFVCGLLAFGGMYYAVRAYGKGHRGGIWAFVFAVFMLVFWVVSTIWFVQNVLPMWMGGPQVPTSPEGF